MKKTTLWDVKILSAAIGIIGKSAKKTEAEIQAVAVQCIAQSIVHRNSTPAQQLYDNLPRGMRHDSLVAYFTLFGNLAYSKEHKGIVFYDVEKLERKPALVWTDAYAAKVALFHWTNGTKKPVPANVFDAMAEVNKLLERLTKLASDTTKEVKHSDLVSKITAVVNAYSFDEFRTHTKAELTEDDKKALLENAATYANAVAILDNLNDVESEAEADAALADVVAMDVAKVAKVTSLAELGAAIAS